MVQEMKLNTFIELEELRHSVGFELDLDDGMIMITSFPNGNWLTTAQLSLITKEITKLNKIYKTKQL